MFVSVSKGASEVAAVIRCTDSAGACVKLSDIGLIWPIVDSKVVPPESNSSDITSWGIQSAKNALIYAY
jgi:hypothetical protein